MKTGLLVLMAMLIGVGVVTAGPSKAAQKRVTMKGEGGCELCEFDSSGSSSCEMGLLVSSRASAVIVHLVKNDVYNKAVSELGGLEGGTLCQSSVPINVTGSLAKNGSQYYLTPSKITKARGR